jgi:hypothetical protein
MKMGKNSFLSTIYVNFMKKYPHNPVCQDIMENLLIVNYIPVIQFLFKLTVGSSVF